MVAGARAFQFTRESVEIRVRLQIDLLLTSFLFIVYVLKDRLLKLNLDNAVMLQDSVDVKHLDIAWLVSFAVHEEIIHILHSVGLLDICRVDTFGLVRIC